jgi:hypothetical protein
MISGLVAASPRADVRRRAAALTTERRREIARKAVAARWVRAEPGAESDPTP